MISVGNDGKSVQCRGVCNIQNREPVKTRTLIPMKICVAAHHKSYHFKWEHTTTGVDAVQIKYRKKCK